MICGACFAAGTAAPGQLRNLADFNSGDPHNRMARRSAVAKCARTKPTACSLKLTTALRDATGPHTQPMSGLYTLPRDGGSELLTSADTGELIRVHRLLPRDGIWAFCGYYRVHRTTDPGVVCLRFYVHPALAEQ
jgi:hypothetical protein